MTYLTGLNPVRVTITGARGPVGVELEGPLVPGQFLVWNGNRKVQSASGTGADAGLRTDLLAANGGQLVRFQQSGTGATVRTVQGKLRDVLNVADELPVGYVTDGSVDYTIPIQRAIDKATAGKRQLVFPSGLFLVTGSGLSITGDIDIQGSGFRNTNIINRNGTVLRVEGQFNNLRDIAFTSDGGGATILQSGLFAQSTLERVYLVQNGDAFPIWNNASHEYIDNRIQHSTLQHTLSSTVSAFILTGPGGINNDNVWRACRIQFSGNAHFFLVETTTANAQYALRFEDLTFEVCLGGGIRLRGVNGFVISNCQNWDADTVPIRNDFYMLEVVSGIGCVGQIHDCGRWAGTMAAGKFDVKLPGGGAGNGIIVANCRTAGGGDPFKIDALNNGMIVMRASPNVCAITNDVGAIVLDASTGYMFGGKTVLKARGAAIPQVPLITSGSTVTAGDFNGLATTVNALLQRLQGSTGHGLIEG